MLILCTFSLSNYKSELFPSFPQNHLILCVDYSTDYCCPGLYNFQKNWAFMKKSYKE